MEKDFIIIAITLPYFFTGEAEKINQLLETGEADFVHLRKPGSMIDDMEKLISQINPRFYPRLKLHDHFSLLDKYQLGGIHLNNRNPQPIPAREISKSIHSYEELDGINQFDYFFISPVFDSISKKGYKASFELEELSHKIKGKNAIALGGVTPDKFPLLKSLGFHGAALLGHFFQNT